MAKGTNMGPPKHIPPREHTKETEHIYLMFTPMNFTTKTYDNTPLKNSTQPQLNKDIYSKYSWMTTAQHPLRPVTIIALWTQWPLCSDQKLTDHLAT